MAEDETQTEQRRRPRWRPALAGGSLVALILVAVVWSQRNEIAIDYIDGELARRGVQASYEIGAIGVRTQRLENLVIGDPARPDLTARWVEIDIAPRVGAPAVTMIRARGVRLRGRIADGALMLGEVDRLLPAPSGEPFRLPDVPVDVADAAIGLATPLGPLGIAIAGRGNLADGFRGNSAVTGRVIDTGPCAIGRPRALLAIAIDGGRPRLQGPVRADSVDCEGAAQVETPVARVDIALSDAIDAWRGSARIAAARAEGDGWGGDRLAGRLTLVGTAEQTRGAVELSADGARTGNHRAARVGFNGRYAASAERGGVSLRGTLSARGAATDMRAVAAAFGALDGTPAGPIGAALARATTGAARGFDGDAEIRLVAGRGANAVRVERLEVLSGSGARLAFAGGGATYYWPFGLARIEGEASLAGGGLPEARVALGQERAGGALRGSARIAPFAAGGARLALAETRFGPDGRGGTRFATNALVDGPLGDGRVQGLTLPISGRFGPAGLTVGEGCVAAGFRALDVAGLALGPTRLPLCPTGRALLWQAPGGAMQGGAEVRAPRLAGRLGGTPLAVTAARLRFGLGDFASDDTRIRLGEHRLDLGTLAGRFASEGVRGRFGRGSGQLANVPLLIDGAAGDWSLIGGRLAVNGALTVSDATDPGRFHPLAADDFRLTLADQRITATATLRHPESATRVADVTIGHALETGIGTADLDVPGIAFAPDGFQPTELTRLTTGVVALVDGSISGEGRIRWSPEGVTSDGAFTTQGMNLAANFGPVEGLSGTIRFSDLLGLETAPGQQASVDLIRTGIDVHDGAFRYQLLPDLRVRVESGVWPFAGGELRLEETILDFSRPTDKTLTFRVTGMDGARFIERFEFNNIAATGTFDGVVPMIFGDRGGRIVGGRLEARPEGGTLSYIGELTDKDLGTYGKLAFDALKSLRYDKLDIDLDGSLDGEFVTRIDLDGIARDPALTAAPAGGISGMVVGRALGQLARIPFEFNITIRGPFRTLLATARSLEDPTLLIQSALPAELRAPDPFVQPQESENEP